MSSVIGMSEAPKSTRPAADLLDAAAGADGLIVDLDAGMRGAVLAEPLGVDGIGKGRACPGQFWA